MKLCLVAQQGGHLQQLLRLQGAWEGLDHFHVLTSDQVKPTKQIQSQVYFLRSSDRKTPWRILLNFWPAWRILRKEKPTVILSTGAALAIPFVVWGRLLGIPAIWVDSQANTRKLSGTGALLRRCVQRCYTQWEDLAENGVRFRGRV